MWVPSELPESHHLPPLGTDSLYLQKSKETQKSIADESRDGDLVTYFLVHNYNNSLGSWRIVYYHIPRDDMTGCQQLLSRGWMTTQIPIAHFRRISMTKTIVTKYNRSCMSNNDETLSCYMTHGGHQLVIHVCRSSLER